ncbi:MAG: hypothetical protein KBF93_21430 [Leptospiraceae bacterium]|nr:hypothetical protein [Leptospiraceae bacterium]
MNKKEIQTTIDRIRKDKQNLLNGLRELASGFTIREFAEKLEVNHSRIHKILSGKLDVSTETLCLYIEKILEKEK